MWLCGTQTALRCVAVRRLARTCVRMRAYVPAHDGRGHARVHCMLRRAAYVPASAAWDRQRCTSARPCTVLHACSKELLWPPMPQSGRACPVLQACPKALHMAANAAHLVVLPRAPNLLYTA
eukprot:363749-Chlamydomonas_euryale.AAC.8